MANQFITTGKNLIPLPITIVFGFSMMLFMAQPWSVGIAGIPIQAIMIGFLFAWFFFFRTDDVFLSLNKISPFQWGTLGLIAAAIFNRSVLDGWYLLRFGQLIIGLMIALLGIYFFQDRRSKRIIIWMLVTMAVVSSIFAIFQYFFRLPLFWENTHRYNVYKTFYYGSTGLEYSEVAFNYSLLGIAALLFGGILIHYRHRINLLSISLSLKILSGCIIGAALVLSNSRSGLIATMGAIVSMLLFRWIELWNPQTKKVERHRKKWVLWLIIGLFCAGTIIYTVTVHRSIRLLEDPRVNLVSWQVYIPLIREYPFGIPGDLPLIEALRQLGNDRYYLILKKTTAEGVILPHNLFLTTGVYYGILAAVGLLGFYGSLFYKGMLSLRDHFRSHQNIRAYWVLILLGANIAVFIHSWFHNASIAMGEMRNWLWIGFLIQASNAPSPRVPVVQELNSG